MKKGDSATIRINGESIPVKYLGKGAFAKCYTDGESVYSFIRIPYSGEIDYSKEGISQWADGDNPHIPQYTEIDIDDDSKRLYKSPLYLDLTPANKIAWNQAKELYKAWNSLDWNDYKKLQFGYEINREIIKRLDGKIPESIIAALHSINDALRNYGDHYRFEFPKRNLKVDHNGNLILLDVIFNSHALKSYQESKKRR